LLEPKQGRALHARHLSEGAVATGWFQDAFSSGIVGQGKAALALNTVSLSTSSVPICSFADYAVTKQKVPRSQPPQTRGNSFSRRSCQKVKAEPQLQFPDNAPLANIPIWCVGVEK